MTLISRIDGRSNYNSTTRQRAIANGWRSGLEESLAADLTVKGVQFKYEENKLKYLVPERTATYTPDFYITTRSGKTIVIESKGRFKTEDRAKMLLVKKQHPDLDIRLVFSNPKTKISPQSKTTYAMWCEKHSFLYSRRVVPQEWIDE